jgi:ABC-2 type transport system ATP-binding protein
MLSVQNLTKKYDKTLAVRNASFRVNAGEVAVLLGPNGAGKSTTIKSIAGLLKFDGEIRIDGFPNKSLEAKRRFGYVPESPALYDALTVWEHLEFIARAYRLGAEWRENAEVLLRRFDLDDKKTKVGKELSKGMQQKVSLCCALIIKPAMIMFDEPMIGLDPKAIKELKAIFVELREAGCALLISTHMMDSIEEVWDRVLIMNKGEIILSRTREELEHNGEDLESVFFQMTEFEPEKLGSALPAAEVAKEAHP